MNTQIALRDNELTDEFDNCPVHNTPAAREYDFGSRSFPAATITIYSGCNCATCIKHDDLMSDVSYHTSYQSAASRAAYLKATLYR